MSESKKAKKAWSVTFTTFTDNYKPRGGDWSSMDGPHLFDSGASAKRFLYTWLAKWCHEKLYDEGRDDDGSKGWRSQYRSIYKEWQKTGDLSDIEGLAEEISGDAQYVGSLLDWEIDEDTLDSCDKADMLAPDDDEEEGDSDEEEEEEEEPAVKKRKVDEEPAAKQAKT